MMSRLIWTYAVCKCLLLSPIDEKELSPPLPPPFTSSCFCLPFPGLFFFVCVCVVVFFFVFFFVTILQFFFICMPIIAPVVSCHCLFLSPFILVTVCSCQCLFLMRLYIDQQGKKRLGHERSAKTQIRPCTCCPL